MLRPLRAGTRYRGSISPHASLHDFFAPRPVRPACSARSLPRQAAPDRLRLNTLQRLLPLTASRIAWALDRLGPDARRLNVVTITVQPEIETPKRVIAFSRKHRLLHRWRYLIGSPAEVSPVLKEFGIAPEELPTPGGAFASNGALGAHGARIVLADTSQAFDRPPPCYFYSFVEYSSSIDVLRKDCLHE